MRKAESSLHRLRVHTKVSASQSAAVDALRTRVPRLASCNHHLLHRQPLAPMSNNECDNTRNSAPEALRRDALPRFLAALTLDLANDPPLASTTNNPGDASAIESAEKQRLIDIIHRHARSDDPQHAGVCTTLFREMWARWDERADELALSASAEIAAELVKLRPDCEILYLNLALCLRDLFERTGDPALLHKAVQVSRAASAMCSSDHPERASCCESLADSLYAVFLQTNDIALLDEYIQLKREVSSLQHIVLADHVKSHAELALALRSVFEQTGNMSALDEALQISRDALALQPDHHPHRAFACASLAAILRTQFGQTGDVSMLDEAIQLRRDVLALRPSGHPDRASSCGNLAASLCIKFHHTGNVALLDEAIQLQQEQLSLQPLGHLDRANSCANLAVSLRAQFSAIGDMNALLQAIRLNREALAPCPATHPDHARFCTNLAVSLFTLVEQTADAALLEEAIDLEREALTLRHPASVGYSESCENLASLLFIRYRQTGAFNLMDEAVHLQRKVISLRPLGDPNRAMACSKLARLLMNYFARTGAESLCDEAIQLSREAQGLQPIEHPDYVVSSMNLAASLHTRFEQTNNMEVLDEIISLQRKALVRRPTGYHDSVIIRANLAQSLCIHYEHTERVTSIDEAIQLEREALSLRPPGHADHALACSNLALSLHTRAEYSKETGLLEEAIELYRKALSLHPKGHSARAANCTSLAFALQQLSRTSTYNAYALESEALTLWKDVLLSQPSGHPDRWQPLTSIADQAIRQHDHTAAVECLSEAVNSPTHDVLRCVTSVMRHLVRVDISVLSHHQRQVMLQSCSSALDLIMLATDFALDHSAQLPHALKGSSLGLLAFRIATLVEELPIGLALLERARGVIWSLTLQLRNPQLDRVPADLAEKLRMTMHSTGADGIASTPADRSSALGMSFLPERDMLYEQRSRRQQVVREIRSLPGLSDFMRGPDVDTLLATAASNPIVVLIAGEAECHALIIASTHQPLVDLRLPGIHVKDLRSLRFGPSMPSQRGSSVNDNQRIRYKVSKPLSHPAQVLSKIWRTVVKPVITCLNLNRSKEAGRIRIHWCLTGAFAFVPVHAAGVYEGSDKECCSDYVVSSYTPTLVALLRSQQDAKLHIAEDLKLLLVSAPQAQDPSLPRLRFVEQETREIAEISQRASIPLTSLGRTAAESEVMVALQSAHMVHLACHGVQDGSKPHKSHFCLRNSNLTVEDLMKADLKNAFCAFLSACETAKGDQTYADEAVHLAATMLFAGFKSVVATMWQVSSLFHHGMTQEAEYLQDDRDGPFIAKRFYEKLFESETIDVDAVPRALDHAVQALRESGASPERWATFIHMGA